MPASDDMVGEVLAEAVRQRASDIHLEPQEDGYAVRMRVDGVMLDVPTLSRRNVYTYTTSLSKLKVLAKLNIAERRLPQDGSFRWQHHSRNYEFRLSSLPTLYGERMVLRVLEAEPPQDSLHALGLSPAQLTRVEAVLKRASGLVLVTGPTGCGKTTTLHTMLKTVVSRARCVLSVEDPVEYRYDRISQVQVRPDIGLDFATVLRAFLRQDPDAIMVGEIRDHETAEIAMRAALTGHLVLTSLHATGVDEALQRLREMDIPSWLVASAPQLVLTQRLLRRLCPTCAGAAPSAFCPCLGTGYAGRIGVFDAEGGDSLRHLRTQAAALVDTGMTDSREVLRVLGT